MRKHKSNFQLVNEFYELEDSLINLDWNAFSKAKSRTSEILKQFPIEIAGFRKAKSYLYELNQFEFIIHGRSVFCKKKDWFYIILALKEIMPKPVFLNIRTFLFISKENLMKLISLRNHENFDNILMLAENGQMDIINSLTL
jgi:hypothetical protein